MSVVLLKGKETLVGTTNGDGWIFKNTTGNPGMATAGAGDVLTGVIGALMAQGLNAFEAAVAGAYIHGLAGDRARDELGPYGVLAGDLIRHVAGVLKTSV